MTAAETAATTNTARSSQLYERARDLLPGGVNSPVRAMRSIGRDPIFIASGSGSTITDVDGNDYIDWVSSWGPLILGHADPDVVAAVTEAAAATAPRSARRPKPRSSSHDRSSTGSRRSR